jgi:hypothetical protein
VVVALAVKFFCFETMAAVPLQNVETLPLELCEEFARTTICFLGNCSKADSAWRTVVKEFKYPVTVLSVDSRPD